MAVNMPPLCSRRNTFDRSQGTAFADTAIWLQLETIRPGTGMTSNVGVKSVNQVFLFNNMSATLVSTTDEVLMNAARYHARVVTTRATSAIDTELIRASMVEFSLILAHVTTVQGFPFAVPDPLAHPETVGLAWDAYRAEDPALWDRLLQSIQIPVIAAEQIEDKLPQATLEMDALSKHSRSPFKPRQTGKR
jgi:hypothetical protein